MVCVFGAENCCFGGKCGLLNIWCITKLSKYLVLFCFWFILRIILSWLVQHVFSFVKVFVLLSGWYLVSWDHCHWAGQGWASELRHAPHESALPHPQEHTAHPQRRLLQDFQRVCGLLSQQRPYICKHSSSIAFSCRNAALILGLSLKVQYMGTTMPLYELIVMQHHTSKSTGFPEYCQYCVFALSPMWFQMKTQLLFLNV